MRFENGYVYWSLEKCALVNMQVWTTNLYEPATTIGILVAPITKSQISPKPYLMSIKIIITTILLLPHLPTQTIIVAVIVVLAMRAIVIKMIAIIIRITILVKKVKIIAT